MAISRSSSSPGRSTPRARGVGGVWLAWATSRAATPCPWNGGRADRGRQVLGQRPHPAQRRAQALAVQVLHDDEGAPAGMDVAVVDLDDARVVDEGGGLRLGEEAREHALRAAVLGQEQLDRDAPP